MDFGTTNSGMAVYNGRSVNVLNIDPQNSNPGVARTAIYITNDHTVHIGRSAIDHYFEHNVGRAVKMRKVWVGEIEIYAEDLYYVTDAYAFVDVLSPGRLFLSIKSGLRSEDFPGTVIGQHYYSLENLISTFLTTTKIRAEKQLGQEVNQIVLGRPVRFAFDEEKDRLAQGRLLQSAFQAGYEKVYFQYEPIAAAYSYETTLDKPENVLVFDFGGGTLDVTIMRLGDPKNRGVLATGGIPIAGDVFDQKIVRHKLARHFGEGSPYGPRHKNLSVPGWIYDTFSNWQTILELQSSERKQMLKEIAQTARRRYQIEALVSVVSNNYGLRMFDVVEASKRQLSDKRGTEILFEGPGFSVRDFVTRREFENIIRQEIIAIDEHLDEMMTQAGLTAENIDTVIRTGGSAQIPAFVQILEKKFGAEKVRSIDTFSSVTAGLGIVGHRVEAGEIELKAYTPDDLKLPENNSQPNVTQINLDMIQRRILAVEGDESAALVEEKAMMVLGEDGVVTAVPLPTDTLTSGKDYDLEE
ncbi:MAG: Hsp70 family protein, partial [Chloroflexota bacterium]